MIFLSPRAGHLPHFPQELIKLHKFSVNSLGIWYLVYPLPHHPRTLKAKKALRPGYQSVQDARQWQVVARCIQQQAPVREAGKVLNLRLVDKELCRINIECVRIQRELTVGVEENEENLPGCPKS